LHITFKLVSDTAAAVSQTHNHRVTSQPWPLDYRSYKQ